MRRVGILLFIVMMLVSPVTMAEEKIIEDGKLRIENQGQGQETEEQLEIEEYWGRLKKRADELYGKANLKVEISTSIYSDGEYKGEAKMEVPIFNADKRKKIKNEKMKFLDKGAKLLNELETNLNNLEILREKEVYFKALITTNGASSIKDYYRVKEDIIDTKAEINEARRKLEVMVM